MIVTERGLTPGHVFEHLDHRRWIPVLDPLDQVGALVDPGFAFGVLGALVDPGFDFGVLGAIRASRVDRSRHPRRRVRGCGPVHRLTASTAGSENSLPGWRSRRRLGKLRDTGRKGFW